MDLKELLEVKPLVDIKIISETLTRLGIVNKKKKVIYPSCYLYEKDGKYYLAHFKQMFLLTRENAYQNISTEDITRRNAIAFCLKNWKLIDVPDESIVPHDKYIYVLPHKDKRDWTISHKFNIRSLENNINTK